VDARGAFLATLIRPGRMRAGSNVSSVSELSSVEELKHSLGPLSFWMVLTNTEMSEQIVGASTIECTVHFVVSHHEQRRKRVFR
jgi:hypothetical protein